MTDAETVALFHFDEGPPGVFVQRAGQLGQQYARPVPSGRHERTDAGLRGGHAVQRHPGAADDEADVAAGRG